MRCLICGNKFFNKRTLQTLFTEEISFLCPRCKRRYKPYMQTQILPKTDGLFFITSFFTQIVEIKEEAFIIEINSWIKEALVLNNKDNYLLWIDELSLELIETLDQVKGNIHILTKSVFII